MCNFMTPPPTSLAFEDSVSPQAVTVYKPEALPPENSTFLERNFVCRLRCLLDNSTGFLVSSWRKSLQFLENVGNFRKGFFNPNHLK